MIPPRQDEAALWQALCRMPGDRGAWRTLRKRARKQHGEGFETPLTNALAGVLLALPAERQVNAIHAVTRSLHSDPRLARIVAILAGREEPLVRRLAVVLVARWSGAVPAELVDLLVPLLRDVRIPSGARRGAAVGLLRSMPGDGDPREEAVLRAVIEGTAPVHAVRRLQRLEREVGPRPLLRKLHEEAEGQVRMQCPRCAADLPRAQIADHLWELHRLVLDGSRVTEPWPLIEDWLATMRRSPNPAQMARCLEVARLVDPENGPLRLQQLILRARLSSPEAELTVRRAAVERRASICPSCYALIPVPRPSPGQPLNQWRGRLTGHGYRLELSDGGLLTSLEIETPQKKLYSGRDPQRLLTLRGALLLIAGPPVLLAMLFAFGVFPLEVAPVLPVLACLGLSLAAMVFVHRRWKPASALADRAIDLAWTQVVPLLHSGGYNAADGEFVAGLALVSPGHGRVEWRRSILEGVERLTAAAGSIHSSAPGHFAALRRLAIHDVVAGGGDPVPLVVAELAHCLEGRLPLACGEALLSEWKADWWTPGNRKRLRVLLCDQAFGAGFEVRHLLEIGRTCPALGAALETDDPDGLTQLRLLWSQRASVPWEKAGEAMTAFEVALRPDSDALFERFPDLVLLQENPTYQVGSEDDENAGPLRIAVTGRGLVVQTLRFLSMPEEIVVIERPAGMETRYELRVDGERFHFSLDPTAVAERLERWFRYLFKEFLPQAPAMLHRDSPDVGARLRARGASQCPECERALVLRAGEMAGVL